MTADTVRHQKHDCNDGTCQICWGAGPVCSGCGDDWPCPSAAGGGK